MLVHVVLFNFKKELNESERQKILDICKKKVPMLPGVNHLLVGKSIKGDSEFTYALSMYFADENALQTYRNHPDHVHFRDVEFFPFLENVKGLDYAD